MKKKSEKFPKRYERTSIVAGKIGHKIIAPLQYSGITHGDFLEVCFEALLIPELDLNLMKM